MPSICGNIVNGHIYDCNKTITGGAEQEAVLMNRADIDKVNSVIDRTDTTHKVTHLQLYAGKTGYLIGGAIDKKHIGGVAKFNRNDDGRNDYEHGFNFKVYDLSEETLSFLKQLGKGADLVVVMKMKDTGVDGNTKYSIYGYDSGLKLSELNLSTLEGKGTTPIILKSVDDMEPHLPMIYFDTDQATSDTQFDAKFSA